MIYGSHENNVYDDYFPADGGVIGAKNYCRTYGSYRKPYCFIDNPYITYGYCNLRICNGKSNHATLWTIFAAIVSSNIFCIDPRLSLTVTVVNDMHVSVRYSE